MLFFSRVCTAVFLALFGLFLGSPVFALQGGNQKIVIVSSGFGSTCTQNIQCQKVSEENYECHVTGDVYSNLGSTIQHIPVGKIDAQIISQRYTIAYTQRIHPRKKEVAYIEPDPFVYPFVRIIKIQI